MTAFVYPAYATEHPTGTGPFKFAGLRQGQQHRDAGPQRRLLGREGQARQAVFKIIPDETARKQELKAGTIDGLRPAQPGRLGRPQGPRAINVAVRPAFNILYLGINQKNNPKLADLKVRQALAYALNREQLVESQLPEGAEVATQFYPDTVDGCNAESSRRLRPGRRPSSCSRRPAPRA